LFLLAYDYACCYGCGGPRSKPPSTSSYTFRTGAVPDGRSPLALGSLLHPVADGAIPGGTGSGARRRLAAERHGRRPEEPREGGGARDSESPLPGGGVACPPPPARSPPASWRHARASSWGRREAGRARGRVGPIHPSGQQVPALNGPFLI
jgi:hypothetical protein